MPLAFQLEACLLATVIILVAPCKMRSWKMIDQLKIIAAVFVGLGVVISFINLKLEPDN
jgi:hypothetical protein